MPASRLLLRMGGGVAEGFVKARLLRNGLSIHGHAGRLFDGGRDEN